MCTFREQWSHPRCRPPCPHFVPKCVTPTAVALWHASNKPNNPIYQQEVFHTCNYPKKTRFETSPCPEVSDEEASRIHHFINQVYAKYVAISLLFPPVLFSIAILDCSFLCILIKFQFSSKYNLMEMTRKMNHAQASIPMLDSPFPIWHKM